MGATSYRMFADYRPAKTIAEEPVADTVNTIPKVVFSSTLDAGAVLLHYDVV